MVDDTDRIVVSIIKFIKDEIETDKFSIEQKESLEVAIQCFFSTYNVEKIQPPLEPLNLRSLLTDNSNSGDCNVEIKSIAEESKLKGNEAMKNLNYAEAVDHYSKAINFNPSNALYYSNRAAAYIKSEKYLLAVNDCSRAITIDPTYGKAYGRLGNAYSCLGLYEKAKEAYENGLKYDPTPMYEENIKLCEEHLSSDQATTSNFNTDFSQIVNNPQFINMVQQMLSDPSSFRNVLTNIIGSPNESSTTDFVQSFANTMQNVNHQLVEQLLQQLNTSFSGNSDEDNINNNNNNSNAENVNK